MKQNLKWIFFSQFSSNKEFIIHEEEEEKNPIFVRSL